MTMLRRIPPCRSVLFQYFCTAIILFLLLTSTASAQGLAHFKAEFPKGVRYIGTTVCAGPHPTAKHAWVFLTAWHNTVDSVSSADPQTGICSIQIRGQWYDAKPVVRMTSEDFRAFIVCCKLTDLRYVTPAYQYTGDASIGGFPGSSQKARRYHGTIRTIGQIELRLGQPAGDQGVSGGAVSPAGTDGLAGIHSGATDEPPPFGVYCDVCLIAEALDHVGCLPNHWRDDLTRCPPKQTKPPSSKPSEPTPVLPPTTDPDLSAAINSLTTAVAGLSQELKHLHKHQEQTEIVINNNVNAISSIEKLSGANDLRIAKLDAAFSNLKNSVAGLPSKKDLEALQATVLTLTNNLQNLQATVATLPSQDDLTSLTQKTENNQTSILALLDEIETLPTKEDVLWLNAAVKEIKERLALLEQSPTSPPEELKQLAQDLEDLKGKTFSFQVVFEEGNQEDEPERRITVTDGGTLSIPPQQIRIRNVDKDGNELGEVFLDAAPLGKELRIRNRFPMKASQR